MDEFLLAFNQQDAAGWAASLNYPHVRFASGTVTVWNSAADFSDTDAFEMLSKSGWDHSHWLTRDVVLVSPQKVHIATAFQRFNNTQRDHRYLSISIHCHKKRRSLGNSGEIKPGTLKS